MYCNYKRMFGKNQTKKNLNPFFKLPKQTVKRPGINIIYDLRVAFVIFFFAIPEHICPKSDMSFPKKTDPLYYKKVKC